MFTQCSNCFSIHLIKWCGENWCSSCGQPLTETAFLFAKMSRLMEEQIGYKELYDNNWKQPIYRRMDGWALKNKNKLFVIAEQLKSTLKEEYHTELKGFFESIRFNELYTSFEAITY